VGEKDSSFSLVKDARSRKDREGFFWMAFLRSERQTGAWIRVDAHHEKHERHKKALTPDKVVGRIGTSRRAAPLVWVQAFRHAGDAG